VKVVKQLSKDLASIPEFAARCSVINSTKSKEKLWSEVSRNTPLLHLLINCGFSPLFT
jgi:short-subunit dehydrogenase involved in D-alanine esterification of teichoic acids